MHGNPDHVHRTRLYATCGIAEALQSRKHFSRGKRNDPDRSNSVPASSKEVSIVADAMASSVHVKVLQTFQTFRDRSRRLE